MLTNHFWIEFCQTTYNRGRLGTLTCRNGDRKLYRVPIGTKISKWGPTGEQWWCPHHIQPISILPFLLVWIIFWIESQTIIVNWIIYWIESQQLIVNWIIFWIEFSLNDFELNIELNQFCAKIKLWIESIWVSDRAILA